MSHSPLCFDPYVVQNVIGRTILNVGCGYGKWGFLLKKYRWPEHPLPYVVGLDAFEPHLLTLRKHNIYDALVLGHAGCLPFAGKSFDSVVACEVLEHLTHEEGLRFLDELRRITRQCFIVSTPNYECLRGGGDTMDGFNEFEAHKYIYSYREFCSLGFTQVIGLGHMQLPRWKAGVAAASVGQFFPSKSSYLMGFWFGDGKKRLVYAE